MQTRYDFRGGYATELEPELMDRNMVLLGRNLRYKGSLKKRPGWANLATGAPDATIAAGTVQGFCRGYMNSAWNNFCALDAGGSVKFYYGSTGAYTEITDEDSAAFTWTTAKQVEMVRFNEFVIAVNGTDKPVVIYYDSAYIVKNLEQYDVRTRGDDEWYAGQWDDSGATTDLQWIDDTTDAQSDTADDFQIASATADDGFYVAGVNIFNKIVITNAPDLTAGSVTATYKYYAGAGVWTAVSMVTTPDWAAVEGNKTIEFNIPLDSAGDLLWEKYGDVSTQLDPDAGPPGGVLNRYIFRVQFTTAHSAGSADKLAVYNTQYLTQIFKGDVPSVVHVHKERLFLAVGRAFRFNNASNSIVGWNSRDIEYCNEGGEKIYQMVTGQDELLIFKEAGIFRYLTTTTGNYSKRFTSCPGAVSPRGAANVAGAPIYVANDGIRAFVGGQSIVLSRHIQSVFDALTKTNAVVTEWDGDVLISFPTNSKMFWADPDTKRSDVMGDGRMSFWDWTGLAANCFAYANGAGDIGNLIALDPTAASVRFVKNTTNGYDIAFDTTQSNIVTTCQAKYDSYDTPGNRKSPKRMKIEVSKSGTYTLTFYVDNGRTSIETTIASGTGTGHYIKDVGLPATMDGYNLSIKLVNDTTNAVTIYGFSVGVEKRSF